MLYKSTAGKHAKYDKRKSFAYLFTFACCLFTSCIFGQVSHHHDNDHEGDRIIKFAVFPFIREIVFRNSYFIQLQHEKAFARNNRFTNIMAFYYEDYAIQSFGNGQLLGGVRKREYTFKLGGRYYLNRSPESYDGFFIGVLPFYSWENIADKAELRHNLGMDAVAGYQWLINKLTLEANMSLGMAGSFYKYAYPVLYKPQQGIEERVFIGAQINLGYLF